jgi:hypothetical protein
VGEDDTKHGAASDANLIASTCREADEQKRRKAYLERDERLAIQHIGEGRELCVSGLVRFKIVSVNCLERQDLV